jgi:pimeloyl-ACP methyl ester carboxylesterase
VLPRIDVPCLIYVGEADPQHDAAREAAARMPRARFASLPGLDHLGPGERPDLVLPLITDFLAAVDAAAPLSS